MDNVCKINFKKAVPVWEKGKENEMNHNLIFRTVIPQSKNTTLRISGHSDYTVKINGEFCLTGPARAAHGFYRVDELDISNYLTRDNNIVSVLVCGYAVNSFYLVLAPSFLCCEIEQNGNIVSATGTPSFEAALYTQRIKRTQRYSFQRPFSEAYSLDSSYNSYETIQTFKRPAVELSETEPKTFISRNIFYPEYDINTAKAMIASGSVSTSEKQNYFDDRAISAICPDLMGFTRDELDIFSTKEADKLDFKITNSAIRFADCALLPKNTFATFDMGENLTGLVKFDITVKEDTTIFALFDEIENNGEVNYERLGCCNVIIWELKKGFYTIESCEPYTYRYIKFACTKGFADLSSVCIRRVDFPEKEINFNINLPSEPLKRIYKAALSTFRQNTFDIYMDCPSRERAGWLCDSFFTSRVEYLLTGKTQVEDNFIENFLLPDSFRKLPKGMLPMCYPSDHMDGVFIPNWAMWFICELEEYYFNRNGKKSLVDAAKKKAYDLLDYFRRFENSDGLLDKLESWIFVEWSKSNELVQDISYPSNMLYVKMKRAIARLYDDKSLLEDADRLAAVIREKSFNGQFFCDNSVYGEDGIARPSGECTESCQYYAFFCGIATPELYPELWSILVNDFGPDRKTTKKWDNIYFANAFIGNYLRLDLLTSYKLYDKVIENVEGYFDYMAKKTGTLWENDSVVASCNHGFASHIIYWLDIIYNKK